MATINEMKPAIESNQIPNQVIRDICYFIGHWYLLSLEQNSQKFQHLQNNFPYLFKMNWKHLDVF